MKKFYLLLIILIVCPLNGRAAQQQLFWNFKPPLKEIYVGQEAFFEIELFDKIGVKKIDMIPVEWENVDVFLLQKTSDKPSNDKNLYNRNVLLFSLVAKSVGKINFSSFCFSVSAPALISSRGLPDDIKFLSKGLIKVCIPPFSIEVKALPEHSTVLFVASKAKLFDGVLPKSHTIPLGTPVKRTFVLAVKGTLPAFLPDFQTPEIDGVRVYNGKTERAMPFASDGITAALSQSMVFVPQEAGELILPETKVSWLNVQTNQIETLTAPSYTLTVVPKKEAPHKKSDDQPLSSQENLKSNSENGVSKKIASLFLLTFVVIITVIFFCVLCFKRRRFRNGLIKAVETACLNGEPEQMSSALLAWASAVFPKRSFRSLADIRTLFEGKSDKFVQRLKELEMFLYGTGRFAKHLPKAKENLGKDIFGAFMKVAYVKPSKQVKRKATLPDLYPTDDTSST